LVGAVEASDRFEGFFTTTAERFCAMDNGVPLVGLAQPIVERLVMNLLILLLYALRVAPKVLDTFYQTMGEGFTPASRLNSLRTVVWERGADTFPMQIGYRLERLLKACYMCIVCLIMLFTLFLSNSILDIVLNALAIEFIWEIDIDLAKSAYWDPRRRWIKAGAVEARIRATLDFHALSSPRIFCRAYDIDVEDYKAAFSGEMRPLKSASIAAKDAADERFMTETDVIWRWAGDIARKKSLANADWQFSGYLIHFGVFDQLLINLGLSDRGLFRRFIEYRTWSTWDEVLFLSAIPLRGVVETCVTTLKSTNEEMAVMGLRQDSFDPEKLAIELTSTVPIHAPLNEEYLNFNPEFHALTPTERFAWGVIQTLLFQSMWDSVRVAWEKNAFGAIPFRILDGLIEWLSHLIQVSFPLMLAGFAILILACY
jgi:hypothetical protein